MTDEITTRAIELVIAACRDQGGRDFWGGYRYVKAELDRLAIDLDVRLLDEERAAIERDLVNFAENMGDDYTGEARSDLVAAMIKILRVRAETD